MHIDVTLGGDRVAIEGEALVALLDNSVASDRAAYRHALERGEIKYSELLEIARVGNIPMPLFFAPMTVVESQLELKTRKLLDGLTKTSFSLNVRETVKLRDIELILKDLIRKQQLLKRYDPTLEHNAIVGSLSKRGSSVDVDAARLVEMLEITPATIREAPNKDAAVDRLILRLEQNQILVSQSQRLFMPQLLQGLHFSGMTVKDAKVPYIFLPSGDEGERIAPAGRRTFTLTLLTVLVARGIFAPVNYDSTVPVTTGRYEYDVAAQILMPAAEFKRTRLRKRADFEAVADDFKVTPSAAIVRALRLNLIDDTAASTYLAELRAAFAQIPKTPRSMSRPVNAVRKYNGRELSRRMLRALDQGRLSTGDFCREVCLNNLGPGDIEDFRRGLR